MSTPASPADPATVATAPLPQQQVLVVPHRVIYCVQGTTRFVEDMMGAPFIVKCTSTLQVQVPRRHQPQRHLPQRVLPRKRRRVP
jgi:hypothetical protein